MKKTIKKDFYSNEVQMKGRKSEWYDDVTRNLTKCPFCDLKDKYLISEKDGMVLTVNLFPYLDGHMMVIPRRHVEKLADLNSKEWAAMHFLIKSGLEVLKNEMGVTNTNILYREGSKESGSSLKHFHIHVLPITEKFMTYQNQGFTWNFQEIVFAPIDMAIKLRKAHIKPKKSK